VNLQRLPTSIIRRLYANIRNDPFPAPLSQSIAITTGDDDKETTQYRDVGWKTEVEIKKDEEVVLMKEADTLYTLLIGGSLNKSE